MNKLFHIITLTLSIGACQCLYAFQTANKDQTISQRSSGKTLASVSQFHPNETVAERDARMKWWREAKFGMFVHFGIYAIPAGGEWYMRNHKIPVGEYAKYATQFNPNEFNADDWTRIAHNAGMKYMVVTSKHHDGFAMFGTAASPYNIVDATPFKRDIIKELSEASPRHDIRFGVYYSAAADWHHPGGGIGGPSWDQAQTGDNLSYIKTVAVPEVRELLSNYGPLGEFWYDTDGASIPEGSDLLAKVMDLQPNLVINSRLDKFHGDFESGERRITALPPKGDWEECATTIDGSWGYMKTAPRPASELLREMIDIVSKGGNYLLNVGPMPNGSFPPDIVEQLTKVGAWMKVNGNSIYGTTAGPFDYLSWGRSTRKGDVIYLHVFDWPKDGILRLPLSNRVLSARLLANPYSKVSYTTRHNQLVLRVPSTAPDPVSSVIALRIEGEPPHVRSLTYEKPAKASAVDSNFKLQNVMDQTGDWRAPNNVTTGWLEVDLESPKAVGVVRVGYNHFTIKKYALEYKDGDTWKPVFEGNDMKQDSFVKSFPTVTSQHFRLNILESKPGTNKDIGIDVYSFELFPPE